jgi:hypothetical protein
MRAIVTSKRHRGSPKPQFGSLSGNSLSTGPVKPSSRMHRGFTWRHTCLRTKESAFRQTPIWLEPEGRWLSHPGCGPGISPLAISTLQRSGTSSRSCRRTAGSSASGDAGCGNGSRPSPQSTVHLQDHLGAYPIPYRRVAQHRQSLHVRAPREAPASRSPSRLPAPQTSPGLWTCRRPKGRRSPLPRKRHSPGLPPRR